MKRNLVKLIVCLVIGYIALAFYASYALNIYPDYARGIMMGMIFSIVLRDCGEYLRQPKEKRKNDSL